MKLSSCKTALLFTVFLFMACSKSYPIHTAEVVRITPAPMLLELFPEPVFSGSTNEDLLLYTLSLEKNIRLCNARLEAIKKSTEK